jgi:uncharacterized membrane protein
VTGVAGDDVLNIRHGPGTRYPVIGTLAPDARGIEVVAVDATGRWGEVNAGEQSGWVAMRYLAYRTDVWDWGSLPDSLHCLGTEPFWSFRPEAGTIRFSTPEEIEGPAYDIEAILDSGVFRDPRRAILARSGEDRLFATITNAACTDGMSDRAYGLTAMVVRDRPEGPALLTGCCRLAR